MMDNAADDGTTTTQFLPVTNPATAEIIAHLGLSTARDVHAACDAAMAALPHWSGLTIKARAAVMLKFHALVEDHTQELVDLIVQENGKNKTEVGCRVFAYDDGIRVFWGV